MRMTFLGANHDVTGSRTLLEVNGRYILIDDGMEQGENDFASAPFPVAPGKIELVLLTHAHIDHTGMLPLLYKQGFRGAVYATAETCSLCNIMLKDSAHIQESEAEYQTRKAMRAGKPAVEPLYALTDVEGLLPLFHPCRYGERFPITEGVDVRFTDIGHLLGSAAIELWLKEGGVERKIVFSGDVGNRNQPIIKDPQAVDGADYLVIESTYGDRLHEQRSQANSVAFLADVIQRTLDRGGNVVIPAFSVGRTQEMLYFIREIKAQGMVHGHADFPVYVDSPLANEATSVFLQCQTDCLDEEARAVMAAGDNPLTFPGLYTTVSADESKALNTDTTPKVILSASGMCDAGRIRHHLKYNLWRPECTVLFVGYQAQGTLGRMLYDGAKSVKLFGDEVAVNAEVQTLPGVSGHADQQGLLDWYASFSQKPAQVFVNHGDDRACTTFAQLLVERFQAQAQAPYSGSVYDLGLRKWIYEASPQRRKKGKAPESHESPAYQELFSLTRRFLEALPRCRGFANRELRRMTQKVRELLESIDS